MRIVKIFMYNFVSMDIIVCVELERLPTPVPVDVWTGKGLNIVS